MHMFSLRRLTAILALLLVSGTAYATTVVVNDSDWRSAYILGYYAPMKGYGFVAVASEASAKEVLPYVMDKGEEIIVYEGSNPVVKNYAAYLRAQGFTNVRSTSFSSAYDLMFEIPDKWGLDLTNAVLVSDSAGEWVLSAGPLAYASNSYLLLLNNRTKDDILAYLSGKNVGTTYVIGYGGKSLKTELPDAVFISTGSRAKDSAEIAKEMKKYGGYGQVYLMSGLFLYLPANPTDVPIWTGAKGRYPILISYLDDVPEAVMDVLNGDDVKAIVVVGPELDPRWAELRDEFSGEKQVLALFAVGYVNVPTRTPGKPYPLPVFFLPSASVRIDVESANVLPDGNLFLKLRNIGDAAGYVLPTYIRLSCGTTDYELTPSEPVFVDAKDYTIAEYAFDLPEGEAIPLGRCNLYVEAVYGADTDRMELDFNKTVPVMVQGVNDPSSAEILRIVYSPRLERFVVYVKNTGDVPTYATVYLHDVLIDGVPTELKTKATLVKPGETKKLYAKAFLTDADILDNPEVKYTLRYGKDSGLPVHAESGALPLEKETLQDVVLEWLSENYILAIAALVLIIVLLMLLRKR